MPGWSKPTNLSGLLRDNYILRLTCKACGHWTEPDLIQLRADLTALGGYREDLSDLPRYLSCSQCGERSVKIEVASKS